MAIGSWHMRVALGEQQNERPGEATGALLAQLLALVRDPLRAQSPRRCVMLSVPSGQPHDAVERLSLLFLGNVRGLQRADDRSG